MKINVAASIFNPLLTALVQRLYQAFFPLHAFHWWEVRELRANPFPLF